MIKKILVTGGAGYIGPKLVDRLIEVGNSVVVFDNLSTGYAENINKKAKLIKGDILDKNLVTIIKKINPDIVFHLAALKSVKDSAKFPVKFAEANVLGSLNLLDAMQKNGVKKLVFFSTSGVYGNLVPKGGQNENQSENPSSTYACSKLAIEKYINYYNTLGMQGIVLRFANVYGIGGKATLEGAVNKFARLAKLKKEIVIDGNGTQTRDFINVNDLVDLCIKISNFNFTKALKTSMIYNVSTGREVPINYIIKQLDNPKFKHDKKGSVGQIRSVLNPNLAKKVFNWVAKTSLKKGMEEMI